MKLQQSHSSDEPEISVIPLIDVLLVLVLFFMVSTTFLRESAISIKLPEADATADPQERPDALEIAITRDGGYHVNGRALINNEERTLRAAIETLAGENREQPVLIRGDAEAPLQAVVTAFKTAGQLGFVAVEIATMAPPAAD